MPRYLSIVLGTACNIACPYCYQTRTNETLMPPGPIGDDLRRELSAFYPYLSTLRIGGGEVFVVSGFEELVDEVAATVNRPLISISTNGTLIDRRWAEKIVGLPFQEVTVSIDGATPETYARLRRGATLKNLLRNVDRIQQLKARRNGKSPDVNFFFLVMRSNFREIPLLLTLAKDHGVEQVAFQVPVMDERNLSRDPGLRSEVEFQEAELRELYEILRIGIPENRRAFRRINVLGLQGLFRGSNLDADFLQEDTFSIYPGSVPDAASQRCGAPEALEGGRLVHETAQSEVLSGRLESTGIELCPNPWTVLFVSEGGNVHVCFAAPPVGNIYESPLIRLWNSPGAIAARSEMVNGRYDSAGCSKLWCSWREGKRSNPPARIEIRGLIKEFRSLTRETLNTKEPTEIASEAQALGSVRRLITQRSQTIAELQANYLGLCEKNRQMLETADKLNQALTTKVCELENALRLASSKDVALTGEVRFRNGFSICMKKAAIGGAVRIVQILQQSINLLKRFINWVGAA